MKSNPSKNRHIRIFISSTFRDMMAEREHLMKVIFPELRKRCKTKFIEITEIDLRWGISEEDAENGKVIEICLNEIDNSRPYFIGILGNRYGWIPDPGQYQKHQKIIEDFPWVKSDINQGLSITEMEIQYGVLRNPSMDNKAFFYLKEPGNETYADTQAAQKLNLLRERIQSQNKLPQKTYNQIEELGQYILNDLWLQIETDFPDHQVPDDHDREKLKHTSFLNSHLHFYHDYDQLIPRSIELTETHNKNKLAFFGQSGIGKSACMANLANEVSEECLGISYFCGASPKSIKLENLVKYIAEELKREFNISYKIPTVIENPHDLLSAFLDAVPTQHQVNIYIDGVDQISANEFNQRLQWIPTEIPPHIKFFISTTEEATSKLLQQKGFSILSLNPISPEAITRISEKYFNHYSKKLPVELIRQISEFPLANNPSVLLTLLNELRIFGIHEKLGEHVNFYLKNETIEDFFGAFLERLENDYGTDKYNLPGILSSIQLAEIGLSEPELLEVNSISQLAWSQLYNNLEYHLVNKSGILSFNNTHIKEAIRKKYLFSTEAIQQQLTSLTNYFHSQFIKMESENQYELERITAELPKLLLQQKDYDKLKDVFSSIPVLLQMFKQNDTNTARYFSILRDEVELNQLFHQSLETYLKNSNNDHEKIKAAFIIGNLFFTHDNPQNAVAFFNIAFEIYLQTENNFNSFYLHQSLKDLAMVYSRLGKFDNAVFILEKILPFHTDETAADTINLLGQLYRDSGKYALAEILFQDNLSFTRNRFGKESIECAIGHNNLARLYDIQFDFEKASENYIIASKILYNSIGPEHSLYQIVQSNIGILYMKEQKLDEAEDVFNEVYNLRSKTLGQFHIKTLKTLNSIGTCKALKGDHDNALTILTQVYENQCNILGSTHSDSLLTLSNIADTYKKKGDLAQAEKILRNVIEVKNHHYGEFHENTITTSVGLFELLVESGKQDEARLLIESLINKSIQLYGEENRITQLLIRKYQKLSGADEPQQNNELEKHLEGLLKQSTTHFEKNEFEEAIQGFQALIKIVDKELNGIHPSIFTAYELLSIIFHQTQQYETAAEYAKKMFDIALQTFGEDAYPTLKYKIIYTYNLYKATFDKEAYGHLTELGKHHETCLNAEDKYVADFYKEMLGFYHRLIEVRECREKESEQYEILCTQIEETAEKGWQFFMDSNNNEALAHFDKAIELANIASEKYGETLRKPFDYKASLLSYLEKHEEAYQVAKDGYQHITKWNSELDDRNFVFLLLMGASLRDTGKLDEAYNYLSQAEKINRLASDYPNQETVSLNYEFINLFIKANLKDEALKLLSTTIDLSTKIHGQEHDMTKYLNNLKKDLL